MLDRFWFPEPTDDYDPAWWVPLEAVARVAAADDGLPSIDLGDFMLMGREDRADRPRIWLYKHYITRRYLNIDDGGHTYRYMCYERDSRLVGYYRLYRRLDDALQHLNLWMVDLVGKPWPLDRR